jgi:hypothetical protein
MELSKLIAALEQIAPTSAAESWDNVGLLAGDPAQQISRIMLTIDYTPEVADESADSKCDLVIAYHPPIFSPLKRLTPPNLVFDAIRRGVAIYSPHTALDAAAGGTNDMLADASCFAPRLENPRITNSSSSSPSRNWNSSATPFSPLARDRSAITIPAVSKHRERAHFSATKIPIPPSDKAAAWKKSPKSAWRRWCRSRRWMRSFAPSANRIPMKSRRLT